MSQDTLFKAAYPYGADVLALPAADPGAVARWVARIFGMTEVERTDDPVPSVILERDGVRIGFAANGGDPEQDGAAILVRDIDRAAQDITANGGTIGNRRVDTREDGRFEVFFVVAPDGLCYYFHQPVADAGA